MSLTEFFPYCSFPGLSKLYAGLYRNEMIINASGEKAAMGVHVCEAGDIRKIHLRLHTVTTGETLKISLQDKNASWEPDETIDQSGTVTVTDTDDNTMVTVTLDTDRTVAKGDQIYIVSEFDSTVGDLGFSQLRYNGWGSVRAHKTGGSWATSRSYACVGALEDAAGNIMFCPNIIPLIYKSDSSVGTESYGNRFQLPIAATAWGVDNFKGLTLGYGDPEPTFKLYDDSDTLLASTAASHLPTFSLGRLFIPFATPVDLDASTWYRVVGDADAAGHRRQTVAVDTAAGATTGFLRGVMGDWFNKCYYTYGDTGSWTNDLTMVCGVDVVLSHLHDGVGAGSSVIPANARWAG